MNIIAIDSGLERTGFAVYDKLPKPKLLEYGCIFTDRKNSLTARLFQLQEEFRELLAKFEPEFVVLERLFFSVNKTSAIEVAQAQGALLTVLGEKDIKHAFITPQEIKLSLTGYGKADKKSVEKMVMLLLDIKEAPKPDDTVDAIACGLAYCTIKKLDDFIVRPSV